ncbi:MAG: acetylglutamate kinase, partial [Halobacteria archaeon]|nr:acetylglutamate kinase [Halobacteria archaeon]
MGGSVLTDKTREETLDDEAFETALNQIAYADTADLILVHGAGSFGHPHAERYDVSGGSRTGIYETHSAVARLNAKVVEYLHERDVNALPVHPLSCATKTDEGFEMMTTQIQTMVDEGFTPAVHGDGVVHERRGASILS